MEKVNSDTVSEIAKALKAIGWRIVKFEDLDGAVTLVIVPQEKNEGAT